MTASDVTVQIDDRLRLLSAVLAVTRYPQDTQSRRRHRPHIQARVLTRYLADLGARQHPAAVGLQHLLDQGAPLEAMFTLVMRFGWPRLTAPHLPGWAPRYWNHHLWDFYTRYALAAFWSDDNDAAWAEAKIQAAHIFDLVRFRRFLEPFVGRVKEQLVFMPNLSYPADHAIGIRSSGQIIAIVPPPLAWGDSPPWPYDEESLVSYTCSSTLTQYSHLLRAYLHRNADTLAVISNRPLPVSDQFRTRHPTWNDQLITLLVAGLVAICLEDHFSTAESKSYMLMEQKVAGITVLPGTVSVLRRYLSEYGSRYQSLIEFLPFFPIHLRVANRLVSL